jgi:TonB family protein
MTTRVDCKRAEVLAGAVALGEASDTERDAYRLHLTDCKRCLANLGGEREIERVMRVVARARDQERWEPAPRSVLRGRGVSWGRVLRWSAALAAVAILSFAGERIALLPHAPVTSAPHALVVVHNVVTLPSQRDERSIAEIGTQTAPKAEQHAEYLKVAPPAPATIADVMPIGGEDAIVPHPSAAAYAEGAEGTTAFDVTVDKSGNPLKCTITKSSGFRVLDEAVCRAAMQARYSPRRVDGRAVTGTYRDAFTFRSNANE